MDMDVDAGVYQADGKVLLFTSKESTEPAMSIAHRVSSELPPILKTLARRFSPIQSK
jgi:hypothetical protein